MPTGTYGLFFPALCFRSDAGYCEQNLRIFIDVCDELGVPVADDITGDPVTFLGVKIDTIDVVVRFPRGKVSEICCEIRAIMSVKMVKLERATVPYSPKTWNTPVIFLNTLQGVLKSFVTSDKQVYYYIFHVWKIISCLGEHR